MPIYEYKCCGCHHRFELLILPQNKTTPACPACKSEELERLLSGFAVNSAEMSRANVRKARKQRRESRDHKDSVIAEREQVQEHLAEHMPPKD